MLRPDELNSTTFLSNSADAPFRGNRGNNPVVRVEFKRGQFDGNVLVNLRQG